MARHASRERVLQGTGRARQHASDTVHAGRNAMRGLRNEPAVRRDGQTLLRTTAGTATSRGQRRPRCETPSATVPATEAATQSVT
jgi:hypothetical protein